MNQKDFSTHISQKNVRINDSFWSNLQELVRKNVIPYQYEALNDRIENAEKSYCVENFKKAKIIAEKIRNNEKIEKYPTDKWCYDDNNSEPAAFKGWVFQDSDAYKWLEAVAYSLINKWDNELYAKAKELIDLICSCQLDDGYLNTLYIINNPDNRFTNLKDFHELYCFGHMAEAAVAFSDATGDKTLLDATCRYADLLCNTFGEEKKRGYGGHEISELALVKLYNATGNKKYLDLAEFFINERGRKPYFFDTERETETDGKGYIYNQAHLPAKEQSEAVGHAVRAVYLYSGMADIARLSGDEELLDACNRIWSNIVHKKMYITGGIGSTVDGEAFTFDYDLPNDLAYCETCASIGLAFFARRMLEIYPNSEFADVLERALYNCILSGMSESGKEFFYVNPLEVLPTACRSDSRKHHVKPVRQKWYGCACCPPNLARFLSNIGEYCASENDEKIYLHQYIGGTYSFDKADIDIESDYIESGRVKLCIKAKKAFTLAVRIPSWSKHFYISSDYSCKNGYALVHISDNANIECNFSPEITLVKCSNLVRENVGKVAVRRGVFIYCAEEADNGKNLQMLCVCTNKPMHYENSEIIVEGFREKPERELYSELSQADGENVEIRLIPYYRWGNRGENEMAVFLRIKNN